MLASDTETIIMWYATENETAIARIPDQLYDKSHPLDGGLIGWGNGLFTYGDKL